MVKDKNAPVSAAITGGDGVERVRWSISAPTIPEKGGLVNG